MEPLVFDIETDDRSLSMSFGQATVRGTAVLRGAVYLGLIVRKGGDVLSDVLRLIIDGSIALEINLLLNWLYDKVKDGPRDTQIRIRRKVVEKVRLVRRVAGLVCLPRSWTRGASSGSLWSVDLLRRIGGAAS